MLLFLLLKGANRQMFVFVPKPQLYGAAEFRIFRLRNAKNCGSLCGPSTVPAEIENFVLGARSRICEHR